MDGMIVTDGDGEEHDGVMRVSRRELITVSVNVTSHNGHTHPPVLSIGSVRPNCQHHYYLRLPNTNTPNVFYWFPSPTSISRTQHSLWTLNFPSFSS